MLTHVDMFVSGAAAKEASLHDNCLKAADQLPLLASAEHERRSGMNVQTALEFIQGKSPAPRCNS